MLPTAAYHKEYNGQFNRAPVFNTGFLGMNAGTWTTVYHRTENYIKNFGHWFEHHAATQLFLCAAMWEMGLRPLIAPLEMACHGHYGTPPGLQVIDNEAYINKQNEAHIETFKVAYAHMLCGL